MQYFPDNTLSHYFTRLAYPLKLTGEWEVGLVEIQYPHEWYNVRGKECWIRVKNKNDNQYIHLILKDGYYCSSQRLIDNLSGLISSVCQKEEVQFYFDEISQRCSLLVGDNFEINMSKALCDLLGQNEQLYSPGLYFGHRVVDISKGFHSLYVYCNVLEPRMVGDSLVPLLRIVPIQGVHGDVVFRAYENVHYVPIQQKSFESIEIDIRDDIGKSVPFESGKLVTTLHFRKRRRFF